MNEEKIRVPRSKKVRINGICGVATNDVNYQTQVMVDGRVIWRCPYYMRWAGMIKRCYSPTEHKRNPTYMNCKVCDEWLLFSNFKAWMEAQSWQDRELDKDILFPGNKIYSPETCVFVHNKVNCFTTDSFGARGEYPLGACYHRAGGKFVAKCSNPFTLKVEHLGLFDNPAEAHRAWKNRKHELACQLADSEYVDDPRVKEVLKNRYAGKIDREEA
jgi:hypothetical protein